MDQDDTWLGGGPRSRRRCVRWGPNLPQKRGTAAPNFRTMSIVAKRLYVSGYHLVGRYACALDGDPSPAPLKGRSPTIFGQSPLWSNGCMDELICHLVWTYIGLSPGDFVLDGDPTAPPKKGAEPPPQFSANVYCGQMAGWIKMALGMEVGLCLCHIVLDWDPSPLPLRGTAPIFGLYLLWPNGWMDQDVTWYGDRPRPRRLCVRW